MHFLNTAQPPTLSHFLVRPTKTFRFLSLTHNTSEAILFAGLANRNVWGLSNPHARVFSFAADCLPLSRHHGNYYYLLLLLSFVVVVILCWNYLLVSFLESFMRRYLHKIPFADFQTQIAVLSRKNNSHGTSSASAYTPFAKAALA